MKTSFMLGNTLTKLPKLPSEHCQAVITDPPYFNVLDEAWDTQWQSEADYIAWTKQWVSESMRILKPDGLFFCFGQLGKREHVFIHIMSELTKQYQFHDLLIWDRVVGYNERGDSFTPAYEMVLVLRKSDTVKFNKDSVRTPYSLETIEQYIKDNRYKDKQKRLAHLQKGKYARNIFAVPSLKGASKEKCGHPSQKPISLIDKFVLCATDKEDTVLDPFMGSGTTIVSAHTLGRYGIGIERDETYMEMAQKRMRGLGVWI